MNVKILVFSQTGNTRKVAEAMVEGFEEKGHSAKLISFGKATEDTFRGDLLGVGTPCFASQAPSPIKNYLRSLPALDSLPAFVFATSGGCSGKVLYDLTYLLRRKGAIVLGGIHVRGETRHPAPCLKGRGPGRPTLENLNNARQFASRLADHVSAGYSDPLPESRPEALKRRWGFYDVVGYMTPDPVVRFLLPKPKLNKDLCNKCQWCVNECPSQNIDLTPYPTLGDQCIRCYRCLTGCPQNALSVNWWFGNFVIWTLYNTIFERLFGDLEPGETIY